jgi:sterol desaturase/sphingolipid hydroxylase (fatty acid hydroxylase superfamily)
MGQLIREVFAVELISSVFSRMFAIYIEQIPIMIGLAVLFTALSVCESQTGSPGKVWWRNPGLATDIAYTLIHSAIGKYFLAPTIIVFTLLLSGVMSASEVNDYFENGRGIFSGLTFWWQAAIYLIGRDFLLYWIHRIFHNTRMWRFHAVHHSGTEVDWTTADRFHPVNLVLHSSFVRALMLVLGIHPEVVSFFIAVDILSASFVHANVTWTLGPFKYILVSPVFHRWHHTMPEEGGNSNFAPIFSFWDWMFGTFYMPEGKLPQVFGNDDQHFPEGYFAQLLYPFKSAKADGADAKVPLQAAE